MVYARKALSDEEAPESGSRAPSRRVLARCPSHCVVLEVVVRAGMPDLPFTEPAHDVLFLTPGSRRRLEAPEKFHFSWNGRNPYCIEFRVQMTTNTFGFRDHEWQREKPQASSASPSSAIRSSRRIQVPSKQRRRGCSSDASLPAFPEHARRNDELRRLELRRRTISDACTNSTCGSSSPDYVVVFASYLNFTRTTQRELTSRLQAFYTLHVRPSYTLVMREWCTFRYDSGRDYDKS